MTGTTWPLVAITIVISAIGACLLPLTRGFTAIGPSIVTAIFYIGGLFCMSRLLTSGMNLSTVIPLMTSTVPLLVLAIAFLVYREPVSPLKVLLLLSATGLTTLAGVVR